MLGTSVGPYRVVSRLGAGGMGEVYLAEDPRLDRNVALKTVSSASLESRDARTSLLREAKAAARLSHPNIASVHDVIDAGDRLHIVMEYVEGETAAALARRGRMTVEQVVDIGIQLTDALADAHAHGILHGDLKPGNIMITPGGRVKVLDFGLAQRWDPAGAAVPQKADAANGTVVAGTLPYMAPERLLRRRSDHRADLYAVGVLLYELLTGRLPFEAADYTGLALATATSVPPAPSDLDSRIPRALSAIVLRALARDPAERYGSAVELRHALERVAQDIARRDTALANADAIAAPEAPHRHRAARLGVAAAAAVIVIGALIAWMFASRSSPVQAFRERDWVLIADFDNRTGEPLFDHTLRATLDTALQQSRYVNVVPRAQVFDALRRMRRQDLTRLDEATAIEIAARENVNVVLAGTALVAGNTFRISVTALEASRNLPLFVETQQFQRRDELFDRVDALALAVRERLGELVSGVGQQTQPLAKVTTSSLEALQLYSRAVDSIARGEINEARALLEGAVARDADFAMAHLRIGAVYGSLGQFNKTLEHYERAYALRGRVTDREAQAIAATFHNSRQDYPKAVESWRVLTRMYPDDLTARLELASALYENGEFEGVIGELRHALRLNPFHGAANARLLLVLARLNRPDEALSAHHQAVSRGVETPYLLWGLGLARLAREEIDDARQTFARLVESGEPYRSLGDLYLAQIDSYQGKLTVAGERLEAGIVLDEKQENVANALLRRYLLGRTALLRGNRRLAAEQARAILSAGEQHLVGANLYQAGTLFVRAGALPDARRMLRQLRSLRDRTPTAFHRTMVELLQGELALAQGQIEDAGAALHSAAAGYPRYEVLEGLARVHEARGEWAGAREAWTRVIAARGHVLQVGFAADWPLAQLALARACRRSGAVACARASYEKFLKSWKNADDLAVRREADGELRQIGR